MQTPADLAKLKPEGAVERLSYVGDAITMMRHMLDGKVPLLGFTGAPVSIQFFIDNLGNNYDTLTSSGH